MASAPAAVTFSARVSRSFEVACTTLIAWSFGLASAAVLLVIAHHLWTGQLQAASPLTLAPPTVTTGLESAQPWGLSFAGKAGPALAAAEAASVFLALAMSMMFFSTGRRLGLLLMIAWTGLWTADAIYILAGSWNHGWWHAPFPFVAASLALLIILAAMIHRAFRLWRIPVSV